MPAEKHTRKANTPKSKRAWYHGEASAKKRGLSRGAQIRIANYAAKRAHGRRARRSRR